jgi:acetyl esterase/lipase
MDIYYPPDVPSETRTPAVIFVFGYPDVGFQKMLGCKQKEMESFISWAQLVAASGLVAITFTTDKDPEADINALIRYIQRNGPALGIEENAIGVWACSAHVPTALSVLMQEDRGYLRCAVLCYGYMLDAEGTTAVAEAAKQYGFANPCAGKSVKDLPKNMSLFIVRAGQDQMPHLNEVLDQFLVNALDRNLPITFINHAAAPHAFDLSHDSEHTRRIIREILAFMRCHLLR